MVFDTHPLYSTSVATMGPVIASLFSLSPPAPLRSSARIILSLHNAITTPHHAPDTHHSKNLTTRPSTTTLSPLSSHPSALIAPSTPGRLVTLTRFGIFSNTKGT
jgi:hypothetical protein